MTYVSLSARSGLAIVCLRIAFSAVASALATALLIVLFGGMLQAAEAPRGGLFFTGPEGPRPAPQPATEVRMGIGGMVARVDVVQYFHNPHDEWQEGVYVFPLPEDAAVDRVRLRIGDRVIVGEIKERQEAAEVYQTARAAGSRSALVEQERPNVFTASVANIGPGDVVAVEIGFQQKVRFSDGAFRLRLPLVVGPRFVADRPAVALGVSMAPAAPMVPAVPDADRVTPPVRSADEGVGNPVKMLIRLDPGFDVETITSPTHVIRTTSRTADGYTIVLDGDTAYADRDFELVWTAKAQAVPAAGLFAEQRDDGAYALVMLTPPVWDAAAETERSPREVVFVIDTSGSMHGASLDQAKRALALALALARLDARDRFNIIRFSDRTTALFSGPQTADADTLRLARDYVATLASDGGTEMVPAFARALNGRVDASRLRQVVFLTDGAVANEKELFSLVRARLGDSRLFTVGIGSAPNGYFMRETARLGRGTFTYIGNVDEVRQRMEALFTKLEKPAVTDLVLDLPGEGEVFPRRLPDLYHGEPLVVSMRLDRLDGILALSGRRAGKTWRTTLDLATARPLTGVAKVWARDKMRDLQDAIHTGVDTATVRGAVTRLAVAHQLMSPYTSLVAVDRTPARPADEALHRREVATNLPAGWTREKVVGEISAAFKAGLQPASFNLPATATAAELKMLVGMVILLFAAFAFWGSRRWA
jgi:Ca-activated chloride channel homolog